MSSSNGVTGGLLGRIVEATDLLQGAQEAALDEGLEIMFNATQEFTPVKKGKLKKSEKKRKGVQKKSGKLVAEVSARTDYAYVVEKEQHYLARGHEVGSAATTRLVEEKTNAVLETLKVE